MSPPPPKRPESRTGTRDFRLLSQTCPLICTGDPGQYLCRQGRGDGDPTRRAGLPLGSNAEGVSTSLVEIKGPGLPHSRSQPLQIKRRSKDQTYDSSTYHHRKRPYTTPLVYPLRLNPNPSNSGPPL